MTNYRRRRRVFVKYDGPKFRINNEIQADQIRLLNEEGEMMGIFDFKEALKNAEEQGVDLVEINPKALPPVIKLIDYNKFIYQLEKNTESKPKKKEDKLIRVSVNISDSDLKVRAKQIDQFLVKDINVRLQVQMKGREKAYPDVAKEVITKFLNMITEKYEKVEDLRLMGDSYYSYVKKSK